VIHLLAAVCRDGGIGKEGSMPWPRLTEDMRRFKLLTMNKTVLMGRKTYESLRREQVDGEPVLPGREVIVVTSQSTLKAPDAAVCTDLEARLAMHVRSKDTLWCVGGGHLYRQVITCASKLYITHIDAMYACDTFFPQVHLGDWEKEELLHIPATREAPHYRFAVYSRV